MPFFGTLSHPTTNGVPDDLENDDLKRKKSHSLVLLEDRPDFFSRGPLDRDCRLKAKGRKKGKKCFTPGPGHGNGRVEWATTQEHRTGPPTVHMHMHT